MNTNEHELFDNWVKSLPQTHWAKYDISACRLGWEAASTQLTARGQALEMATIEQVAESIGEPVDFKWIASALRWIAQDEGFSKVTRRIASGQHAALEAAIGARATAGEDATHG